MVVYKVPDVLFLTVLRYLSARPFAEVAQLINDLKQYSAPVEEQSDSQEGS